MTSKSIGKKRCAIDQPDVGQSTRASGIAVITTATQFGNVAESEAFTHPAGSPSLSESEAEALTFV